MYEPAFVIFKLINPSKLSTNISDYVINGYAIIYMQTMFYLYYVLRNWVRLACQSVCYHGPRCTAVDRYIGRLHCNHSNQFLDLNLATRNLKYLSNSIERRQLSINQLATKRTNCVSLHMYITFYWPRLRRRRIRYPVGILGFFKTKVTYALTRYINYLYG